MPNPLDVTRMLSNPLLLAGAGMLSGSMQRPQSQAHINPWQQGVQGYTQGTGLQQRQQALESESARQKAAESYMQQQAEHMKYQRAPETLAAERTHEMDKITKKGEIDKEVARIRASETSPIESLMLGLLENQLESDQELEGDIGNREVTHQQMLAALDLVDTGRTYWGAKHLSRVNPFDNPMKNQAYAILDMGFERLPALDVGQLKLSPLSDTDVAWVKQAYPHPSFDTATNRRLLQGRLMADDLTKARIKERKFYVRAKGTDQGFDAYFENKYKEDGHKLHDFITNFGPVPKPTEESQVDPQKKAKYGLE